MREDNKQWSSSLYRLADQYVRLRRSLVYPLLQRGGKPTPLVVWFLAASSCVWNGTLQVHLVGRAIPSQTQS